MERDWVTGTPEYLAAKYASQKSFVKLLILIFLPFICQSRREMLSKLRKASKMEQVSAKRAAKAQRARMRLLSSFKLGVVSFPASNNGAEKFRCNWHTASAAPIFSHYVERRSRPNSCCKPPTEDTSTLPRAEGPFISQSSFVARLCLRGSTSGFTLIARFVYLIC